jgi:hypothetical protein
MATIARNRKIETLRGHVRNADCSNNMLAFRLCEAEMKKTLFALILMTLSNWAVAISGNQLMEYMQSSERVGQGRAAEADWQKSSFFKGFVAGAAFTLDDISIKVCLPRTGNIGQYAAVVAQYFKENPAQLHRNAEVLVREALERAFPCK